jgi:hypothetical protein
MNALLEIVYLTRRKASRLFLGAVLLATGGCGLFPNEQEGDQEPTLAEYVVTVNPASRKVDLSSIAGLNNPTPGQFLIPVSAELRVECVGPFVPSGCSSYNPHWGTSTGPGFFGKVIVDNEQSPDTTAVVWFDGGDYLLHFNPNSLTGPSTYIQFYPKSVPPDMALRSGGGRLELKVYGATAIPDRAETPPGQPTLGVFPLALNFALALNDDSETLYARITYSGPPNTLSIEGPYSGGGAASAGKFTLLSPSSSVDLQGGSTVPPPLRVKFQVDKNDFNTYQAGITFSVKNAQPIPVTLTGHRSPF